MTTRTARGWIKGAMWTQLFYLNSFGRWECLFDETGKPANFEGRPSELSRAMAAMSKMDALYGRGA